MPPELGGGAGKGSEKMSQETYEWLARNVLAGFAGTRRPWWADKAQSEGHAVNLFTAEVPMERVEQLLCSWQPVITRMVDEAAVVAAIEAGLTGGDLLRVVGNARVSSHKLVKASDDRSELGVIGIEAATHTYQDWLTGTVRECVGDEAQVSSAGLLRNRAEAWVQIERPDTAVGPDGIKFSPYVTLSTSLGGTLKSQINQNTTMVVCDNTLTITRGQGLAFKHTSGSASKLATYRGVMTAIMAGETDFRAELDRLLSEKVPESAFLRFLDAFIPVADDDAPAKKTRNSRVRQEITQLYRSDPRAEAWQGTAFGVVQAVNTWQTHMSQLRNTTGFEMDDTNLRAMRNYAERLRPPKDDKLTPDQVTVRVLESVLR